MGLFGPAPVISVQKEKSGFLQPFCPCSFPTKLSHSVFSNPLVHCLPPAGGQCIYDGYRKTLAFLLVRHQYTLPELLYGLQQPVPADGVALFTSYNYPGIFNQSMTVKLVTLHTEHNHKPEIESQYGVVVRELD